MEQRPVIPPSVAVDIPLVEGYEPTEAEVKLLRVLLDPDFVKSEPSVRKICDAAGVRSEQTYYTAIKKKGFVDTIKMYAVEPCKGRIHKYVGWLETHAANGSWPHLKALLAMTDTYKEGVMSSDEVVRAIILPGKSVESKKEQGE